VTPVTIVDLDRGATDATAQVLTIKKAAPDVVIALLYPAELAIYLRDAYKYGLRTTTVSTAAASIDDTDKKVGIPAAMNDVFMGYTLSERITSPELASYAQLLKKYYPSEAIDTLAFYTMGGAVAVVETLKKLGPDVTRERFIAELNNLKDLDTAV